MKAEMMNPTSSEIVEAEVKSSQSTEVSKQRVIDIIEHQYSIKNPNPSRSRRLLQNLPCADLLKSKEDYLNICVPLYEASITGDWAAAKVILDTRPELARLAITKGYDTTLHVAASAEETELTQGFVENLVSLTTEEDLELQNRSSNTAFFLAAAAGKIKMVTLLLNKNPKLQTIPGNLDILPLYMCVLLGKYETAKYLYEVSDKISDVVWTHQQRGWVLEKYVECDFFDIALKIVSDCPELATDLHVLGALARKPDAFNGVEQSSLTRVANSISRILRVKSEPTEKDNDIALKLLRTILTNTMVASEVDDLHQGLNSDELHKDLASSGDISGKTSSIGRAPLSYHLQDPSHEEVVENSPIGDAFYRSDNYDRPIGKTSSVGHAPLNDPFRDPSHEEVVENSPISDASHRIRNYDRPISHAFSPPLDSSEPWRPYRFVGARSRPVSIDEHGYAPSSWELVRRDNSFNWDPRQQAPSIGEVGRPPSIDEALTNDDFVLSDERTRYFSKMLFVVAEMGNTGFVIELLRVYPDLIQKKNDDYKTIFHIAVMHRHQRIYNLLYEIGAMKDMITPLKDKQGNNMLHLVGKTSVKMKLQTSGTYLLMQRELLWFKEVEKMMPPFFRERKNKKGQKPSELFSKENEYLVSQGIKWMKDSMVVATLIVTVAFAVAFTVPGGYNQEIGIPIFIHERSFLVFAIADAISLFTSSTSLLVFLSILTSRHGQHDFLRSLPRKLMIGLMKLFISVTAMMITFSASFFVLYHNKLKWVPILIATLAFLPVIIFAILQFSLLVDMFRSMYDSRYLFKPKKHMLYNRNSRF